VAMTPGAMKAIAKIAAKRKPCAECGFPLPKYPGRYPSKCPNCECAMGAKTDEYDDEDADGEEVA